MAPTRTSPILANSDGWTDTGPRASQLRLPLTLTPSGVKTRTCRNSAPTRMGTDSAFHVRSGMWAAIAMATPPISANWSCLRKNTYGVALLVCTSDFTDEADNTMMSPMTTRTTVTDSRT